MPRAPRGGGFVGVSETGGAEGRLYARLAAWSDPLSGGKPLVGDGVRSLRLVGDVVEVELCLPYPAASLRASLEAELSQLLCADPALSSARVRIDWAVAPIKPPTGARGLPGVRNLLAVASAKGGVGKSTVSLNLALALSAEGAAVGLLDADIYGPSQQRMLGASEGELPEPPSKDSLPPIEAHGLQTMSMGYLLDARRPVVWRGPMVSGALQQLLERTRWRDLDYLIVDMPPGTGDIQLTLAQRAPVVGVLIVTTPQEVALQDARRSIEAFRKVGVPVIGVVENMASYVCAGCARREFPFGQGGGARLAADYGLPLLGSLPLEPRIGVGGDGGQPLMVLDPEGEWAGGMRAAAHRLAALAALGSRVPEYLARSEQFGVPA